MNREDEGENEERMIGKIRGKMGAIIRRRMSRTISGRIRRKIRGKMGAIMRGRMRVRMVRMATIVKKLFGPPLDTNKDTRFL